MPPKRATASVDTQGEFPISPPDYLLHLLASVALFRDAALDTALRPFGLNVGRYRTLGVLARFGATTMTELANHTAMDRTTLTRIADHLVADDLVERLSSPTDRRQVLLQITEKGRVQYAPAVRALFDYNGKATAGIAESDLRVAARTLVCVVENIAATPAMRDAVIGVTPKPG